MGGSTTLSQLSTELYGDSIPYCSDREYQVRKQSLKIHHSCQPFSEQAHIVSFSTPVIWMNRHIFMLSEKIRSRNFGLIPSDYNKAADLAEQKFVVYSVLSKTITHG